MAESGVGFFNEGFEVVRGDLGGRDVEGEDLIGKILEREVGPGGGPV